MNVFVHKSHCASLTRVLATHPPQPAPCDCGAVPVYKFIEAKNPNVTLPDQQCSTKPSLTKQIGGSHYKIPIQPAEYVYKNGIGFFEGNVIKYVTRWRDKGGIADLEKAKHYIEMLIDFEKDLAGK